MSTPTLAATGTAMVATSNNVDAIAHNRPPYAYDAVNYVLLPSANGKEAHPRKQRTHNGNGSGDSNASTKCNARNHNSHDTHLTLDETTTRDVDVVANSMLLAHYQPNMEHAATNGLKTLIASNGKSPRPRRETT